MATQYLTRQQLEEALKSDPSLGFREYDADNKMVREQGAQTRSGGILDDLASSFLDPLANASQRQGELANLHHFQRTGRKAKEFKPKYLSDEEYESFIKDPLGSVKDVATVGSYFIPGAKAFGGGIKGLMKSGLLAGGSAGFGGSKQGEEIIDTLTGSALGGGASTAMGLLSKGASKLTSRGGKNAGNIALEEIVGESGAKGNKLQRFGKDLQSDLLGLDATKLKYAPRQFQGARGAERLGGEVMNVLDELKLPRKTSGTIANSIDDGLKSLTSQLNDQLASSGVVHKTDDIVSKFTESFKNNPAIIQGNSRSARAASEFLADLADLGAQPTSQDLAKLKFNFLDKIKFDRATENFPELERVFRAAEDALDNEIKGKVPGVAQTLSKMSTLRTAEPFALTAANKGAAIKALGVEVPVGGATQRARSAIGSLLEKGPNIPIPQNLPSIPGAGQLGSAAQYLAPRLAAQQGTSGQGLDPVFTLPPSGDLNTPTEQGPMDANSFALQAILAGFSPKEAADLADTLGLGGSEESKPMSAESRKLRSNVEGGLRAVDKIGEIINQDNMALVGSNLPGIFQSPKAKQLSTAIAQATDIIGRLRSGGAISEDEEARFRSYLPGTFDDPETIDYKLEEMARFFTDVGV